MNYQVTATRFWDLRGQMFRHRRLPLRVQKFLEEIWRILTAFAVAPLRQIESIVVDGSSFRKIRDNVYQLNLTIRNAAPIALAMPSVDLALTDTQDQPVLRRVLSPADLGAAPVLPAGAEWSGSIPVGVTDSATAARVAGYRVLAFYP